MSMIYGKGPTGLQVPISVNEDGEFLASAGVDSNGDALPPGFDSKGGVTSYTPNATTPTSKTWVKTIGAFTYTQTTTYAYSGADITSKTVSDWVKA